MRDKKFFLSYILTAVGLLAMFGVAAAQGSVEGQPCTKDSPYLYQCTSSDSFTVYRCERPSCVALAQAAEAAGQACSIKYGIRSECVLPLANEFAMAPADRESNNRDDAAVEREYQAMEVECAKPTRDGWKDPCCTASLFSGARACSGEIIKAREAVEACRYDEVAYIYKPSFPVPCGGCVPGKILTNEDQCSSGGVAPSPASKGNSLATPPDQAGPLSTFHLEPPKDLSNIKIYSSTVDELSQKLAELQQRREKEPLFRITNEWTAIKLDSVRIESIFDDAPVEPKIIVEPRQIISPKIFADLAGTEIISFEPKLTPKVQEILPALIKPLVHPRFILSTDESGATEPGKYHYEATEGLSYDISTDKKVLYSQSTLNNLVVLDSENTVIGLTEQAPIGGPGINWKDVQKDMPVSDRSVIVTEANGRAKLTNAAHTAVTEIYPGTIMVAGLSTEGTLAGEPDLVSQLQQVGESPLGVLSGSVEIIKQDAGPYLEVRTPLTSTKSQHTHFAVSYDPGSRSAVTMIYEGAVEVTDLLSGKTATLKPTSDGKPRALIVSLAQAVSQNIPATEVKSTRGSSWVWTLIIVVLAGASIWLYEKGIFKKIIPPKGE